MYVPGGAEPFLTLPVRTGGAESMKKRKMPDPEVVGNIPFISEAAMVGGATARTGRASLNRAALVMLGKRLQDYLDEVRRQEVPERFKLLLRQF